MSASERAIRARAEEEDATMRLAYVAATPRWPLVAAEVDRRAAVYAEMLRLTSISGSGESPRLAALRSVYDDVCRGRL